MLLQVSRGLFIDQMVASGYAGQYSAQGLEVLFDAVSSLAPASWFFDPVVIAQLFVETNHAKKSSIQQRVWQVNKDRWILGPDRWPRDLC